MAMNFLIQHRNLMQKILKHAILCLFAKRFDVNIVHIEFLWKVWKKNQIQYQYPTLQLLS